jgi:peroxiredoxin
MLLIISVGLNVVLGREVKNLRVLSRLLQLKIRTPALVPGSQAPSFSAKEMDGKPAVLNYSQEAGPTVLYIFTPECHWCGQNLENIRFLASNKKAKYRFIGVSLTSDKLEEYLSRNGLPFHVYHSPPDEVSVAYGLTSTPSTIVVSSDGKILQYWRGAYSQDLKAEIESFFQLHLPGLANN